MVTGKQLSSGMVQIMLVMFIMFEIVHASPWMIKASKNEIADGRELMTRHLRSVFHERTKENTFFQIHVDERHRRRQANHSTEAPTNLTIIPDTTRHDQIIPHTHQANHSTETPTNLTTIPDIHQRTTLQQDIPKEPQCVAHHQYARILPTLNAYNDPLALRFKSKNGEIRYYHCEPCKHCQPGVRIIRPCSMRRNTLCSLTKCIDPDDFLDPSTGACFPSISRRTRLPNYMTSFPVIFASGSGGDEVVDEVDPFSTTPSPWKSSLSPLYLCLSGGVLVLLIINVLVLLIYRSVKRAARSRPREISCHSTVSAVIDIPTFESARIDIGLSQDLTITTSDHDTVMKLWRDEAASNLQHNKEKNFNSCDCGDDIEVINGAVSILRGTPPYWLVMMGHFGPEGGVLSCDDSDVVLVIPPGAIPASRPHQLIKAKISLKVGAAAPEVMNEPDFLCLTPFVEFESPGLNKFSKNVLIKLPHKACMTYDPSWTFRTHFTDPTPATKNQVPQVDAFPSKDPFNSDPWYFVDLKNHMSTSGQSSQRRSESRRGVTCTVDEKYFNISTPHFSKYVCSGCHKKHPLQFETVVYASHLKGRGYEEVKLIIYVMDPIKDYRRLVEQEQNEASPPRTRVSEYHRVILDYSKKCKDNQFLEVTLMPDGMVNDWQWKLQYQDHVKAQQFIRYQDLIRCCSSLGPFLHTFHLEPKATNKEELLSVFKAMVYFRQQQRASPQREPVKVVITLPLSDQCFKRELGNTRNKCNIGSTVVTEDQIDVVLTKLLPKDWRRLFRKLMGKNVENEIQGIVARNPIDVHEQKHDALFSWRRSHGRGATVEVLVSTLRSLDLTDIAESLEGINDRYLLKETAL